MAKNNMSRKKLEQLEYNVYKRDNMRNTHENKNGGCLTGLGMTIVGIVVVIVLAGIIMSKSGTTGPARCARLGCTNKVGANGTYCALHSSGSAIRRTKPDIGEEQPKSNEKKNYDTTYGDGGSMRGDNSYSRNMDKGLSSKEDDEEEDELYK